jgi:hypothetical protein
MTPRVLPAQPYRPGETARHPEGLFDPIRDSVRPGMSEAALARSEAMAAGLYYLDHGYFWEAHEVLEPVWMACPPGSASREAAQALIQIANAALKQSMGRRRAAARIAALAEGHLAEAGHAGRAEVLGLPLESLRQRLRALTAGCGDAL